MLLVHGIDDTSRVFKKMKKFLEERGFKVALIDLFPSNGDAPLQVLAGQVKSFIENNFGKKLKIQIVAFSMGGIVCRYYLQRMGGIKRVRRFITISTPHKGTVTARLRREKGAVQMRRNSKFLNDLNKDVKKLRGVDFVSMWTPLDLMIFPATSSKMNIGKEFSFPVIVHPLMLRSKKVMEKIAELLAMP